MWRASSISGTIDAPATIYASLVKGEDVRSQYRGHTKGMNRRDAPTSGASSRAVAKMLLLHRLQLEKRLALNALFCERDRCQRRQHRESQDARTSA
jgi:hypothetical protein